MTTKEFTSREKRRLSTHFKVSLNPFNMEGYSIATLTNYLIWAEALEEIDRANNVDVVKLWHEVEAEFKNLPNDALPKNISQEMYVTMQHETLDSVLRLYKARSQSR